MSIAKVYARDSPSDYALTRLVWFEFHGEVTAVIQRESNLKHWPRAWKARLILDTNSEWRGLYLDLNN
jgi:putative endonuclease